MNCNRYYEFQMGDLPADEFTAHRKSCRECESAALADKIIEDEARHLSPPTSAPGLWEKIAADLESQPKRRSPRLLPPSVPGGYWSMAAVLVVFLGLGFVLTHRSDDHDILPRNLLAAEALARVESIEKEYLTAIEELEALAAPTIASADTRILLQYRKRLDVIDAQIRDCQLMLANDTANAHARRYLQAAYQDKTETLTELLALADG